MYGPTQDYSCDTPVTVSYVRRSRCGIGVAAARGSGAARMKIACAGKAPLLPLTAIFMLSYIHNVECSVLFTDEFERWWNSLSIEEQESVTYSVDLLARLGIELKFPHSSGITGSRYAHMRELRIQHQGRPYRVLYAFDPQRNAVLLIGGDKTGNEQWYETSVPVADRLYERHLIELEESDDHGKSKKL
jgi:hypothetical protein